MFRNVPTGGLPWVTFTFIKAPLNSVCRLQLKCDGSQWCTGGEVEGKTGEWSGYPVLFTLPRNMVYPALLPLMRTTRLPVVDWTDAQADLNGLVRFAENQIWFLRVCHHISTGLYPHACRMSPTFPWPRKKLIEPALKGLEYLPVKGRRELYGF